MRTQRERKKKLIVAFHFQQADQAGWKCDACRKAGLEQRRRCGWLPEAAKTPLKVVWARRHIATEQCPKSEVSAQSLEWIERFFVWKRLGGLYPEKLNAREVEAFLILEQEIEAERNHG